MPSNFNLLRIFSLRPEKKKERKGEKREKRSPNINETDKKFIYLESLRLLRKRF